MNQVLKMHAIHGSSMDKIPRVALDYTIYYMQDAARASVWIQCLSKPSS